MNLRKDAMVAVTLAGGALALGLLSTQVGRAQAEEREREVAQFGFSAEVLHIYVQAMRAVDDLPDPKAERTLSDARARVLMWDDAGKLHKAMDLFRAASVLETSSDPDTLEIAYRMGDQAETMAVVSAALVTRRIESKLTRMESSMGIPAAPRKVETGSGKSLPVDSNSAPNSRMKPKVPVDG